MAGKINWKSVIGLSVAALVAIFIVYTNMQEQKALQNSGKRNVYAVLPLSGPMGQSGKEAQQVMNHYYQKGDYPFNLIYIDSETNPTKAITALQQKTVNDENPIVIAALTGITEAVAPYIRQKNGFLFCFVHTISYLCRRNQKNVFPFAKHFFQNQVDFYSKNH